MKNGVFSKGTDRPLNAACHFSQESATYHVRHLSFGCRFCPHFNSALNTGRTKWKGVRLDVLHRTACHTGPIADYSGTSSTDSNRYAYSLDPSLTSCKRCACTRIPCFPLSFAWLSFTLHLCGLFCLKLFYTLQDVLPLYFPSFVFYRWFCTLFGFLENSYLVDWSRPNV